MITVTLLTKAGCHLCDDVKAALAVLRPRHPHALIEVDITQDETLYARYRHAIPVVRIGKTELQAPITAVQLAGALQAARS